MTESKLTSIVENNVLKGFDFYDITNRLIKLFSEDCEFWHKEYTNPSGKYLPGLAESKLDDSSKCLLHLIRLKYNVQYNENI